MNNRLVLKITSASRTPSSGSTLLRKISEAIKWNYTLYSLVDNKKLSFRNKNLLPSKTSKT